MTRSDKFDIFTRKTLGDLQIELNRAVLNEQGGVIGGLFATREACGFVGGVNGYGLHEGTFNSGCLFKGRQDENNLS